MAAASPPQERRGLMRLLPPRAGNPAERNPLIHAPGSPPPETGRKKGFSVSGLRGLGCASSAASQAYSPAAAVRSSADWEQRRSTNRRRKGKGKGKESTRVGGDVWCAPGIAFAAEASVDCVVERHQMASGRWRGEVERVHSRERPRLSRRVTMQEEISSFVESPPNFEGSLFDHLPSARLRRMRGYHHSLGGFEEENMTLRSRVLLGGMDFVDRHQDWRLDIDNMTYEELLELGDKIGYVSTGLREEEIIRSLRRAKLSILSNAEKKCSICQEEYEATHEEMGGLECGHIYHLYCIKQWLSQKNFCPVCKSAVTKC